MKRGFLLKAQERKAAAKRRGTRNQTDPLPPTPAPIPHRQGFEFNKDIKKLSSNLGYGHLTEEEKALPTDYDPTKAKFQSKESDATLTDFNDGDIVVATIPQPSDDDDETQSEWIANGNTKAKVLNAPGYPSPIPKPRRPDLYQIKPTPEMGQGLFAKQDIKRGDLILAERPLLVAPRGIRPLSTGTIPDHYTPRQIQQIVMYEFETVLETALARLPPESQADFKALHNAHANDGSGPILGIMRSNAYTIDNLYDGSNQRANYGAVCKIGSRINHSCIPNVRYYFKINSFSMQFYAIRDIKANEQLFYTYCTSSNNLSQRKSQLAPYNFTCQCLPCLNATPETDLLRDTFASRINVFKTNPIVTQAELEDAIKLEKDMVKEGLDVEAQFVMLLTLICLACARLGRLEESERYGVLVESFQDCFKSDE